jgi:hypothetical protein
LRRAFFFFDWRSQYSRATVGYEESFQNPVFDPRSRDLHSRFRGRQAELCEDREELPHEQPSARFPGQPSEFAKVDNCLRVISQTKSFKV